MKTTTIRFFTLSFIALGISGACYADGRYKPVEDELVVDECGSCHMAFQAEMLPKASWSRIMASLENHFGEDASLEDSVKYRIGAYLQENAADSGWYSGRFMRGIDVNLAPMRITETPYWVREHNHEVPSSAWSDDRVKSKSNCVACHQWADKGYYDDD